MRPTDPTADTDILNRLQVQCDPRHSGQFAAQAGNDLIGMHLTLAERFERDEHASVVDGRSAAATANERANGVHRLIGQNNSRHLILHLCHCRKRHVLRRIGAAHHDAGILLREKAFGHGDI